MSRSGRAGLVLIAVGVVAPWLAMGALSLFCCLVLREILSYLALGFTVSAVGLGFVLYNAGGRSRVYIASALVGGILLGYLSNHISRDDCDVATARWLVEDRMRTTPFHVLEDDAASETLALFERVGAECTIYVRPEPPNVFRGIPWAAVTPSSANYVPFLVSNGYKWVAEPQVGGGGRRYYICILGLELCIGEDAEWAA